MKLNRALIACAFTSLLVSNAMAEAAPAVVTVESGQVEGHVVDGVQRFLGIPYAAPPTGDLRWRQAQPAPAWEGVLEADAYGADCMQRRLATAYAPIVTEPNEDCLFLNVWRPAEASPEKLPVMIYIYGGGYTRGGSSSTVYGGDAFAKQGVMMVSFSYRVGRFGFFAHPALSAENDEPKGNYGFMDQVFALGWVQRNIEAFGGDPDNVTIVGESAGGGGVHAMVVSPLAEGLFHKAILQSAGGRNPGMSERHLSEDWPEMPSLETIGVNYASSKGLEGTNEEILTALRALPAEEVLDLTQSEEGQPPIVANGGVIDGKLLLENPGETYRAGKQNQVPMILGATTADLGSVPGETAEEVLSMFGERAEEAGQLYNPNNDIEVRELARMIGSDIGMVEPSRFVATEVGEQGFSTYVFRFGYIPEALATRWVTGTPHAGELAFTFNTAAPYYGPALGNTDREVAAMANTYWANFVKSGDPNGEGLPTWPEYDPTTDEILLFQPDGSVAAVADPWKDRMDLIADTAEAERAAN